MPTSRFLLSLLAVSCLLLPACSLTTKGKARQRAKKERALAEARARPVFVGRVTLLNESDRFVLIDGPATSSPHVGTTLRAYRDGAVAAELRTSSIERRPLLIADIVSGEPRKGDEIFLPGVGDAGPAPRATLANAPAEEQPAKPSLWKRFLSGLRLGK